MAITELILVIFFFSIGLLSLIVRLVKNGRTRKKWSADRKEETPPAEKEETPPAPVELTDIGVGDILTGVREILRGEAMRPSAAPTGQPPSGSETVHGASDTAPGAGTYVSRLIDRAEGPREEGLPAGFQGKPREIAWQKTLPSLDARISDRPFSAGDLTAFDERDFREHARHGGWEVIESLPPLKRAIVLTELLGKPKALDEGHTPHTA